MDPAVQFSTPPSWFFDFPPSAEPITLPPPSPGNDFHLRSPLAIDPGLYNAVLSPVVPLTFAAVYVTSVKMLNRYNRENGNQPWGISRWFIFQPLVVLHNIALAIYSAITFVGMVRGMKASLTSPFGPDGLPGMVDSMCKMHGPRGLGDAIFFNATTKSWTPQNFLINLGPGTANPDPTDVGRIWNEGLAFWGWLFYLSKFYEVVDTLIILMKGKRSSTLQTYHHAGAMLCMWAGIRYMSPPIWMFCLVNSGIHAIMYTYYTLSSVSIKVPTRVKRTLTTMQIIQFLIGAPFAATHLFISYLAPVSVHKTIASALTGSVKSMAAAANEDPVAWLKKLALRAGGAEGLAERLDIGNVTEAALGSHKSTLETIKRLTKIQEVRCLDTSGQAFAIWLNVLYLAPLTFLFARFFVRTYFRAATSKRPHSSFSESAQDAARRTSDVIEATGKRFEDSFPSPRRAPVVPEEAVIVDEDATAGFGLNDDATEEMSISESMTRIGRDSPPVSRTNTETQYTTTEGEKIWFRTETRSEESSSVITREVVENPVSHEVIEIIKKDGEVVERK